MKSTKNDFSDLYSLKSNLQDTLLKNKPEVIDKDQNINKSAFKNNICIKMEGRQKECPFRKSPSLDIKNHPVNIVKPAIIMKKKKLKCTNNSIHSKAFVKCKLKTLCDNTISNLDSETLNLTSEDASKFLLSCRFCRKEFETLENFKDHKCDKKKFTPGSKSYECKYCSFTFTQRNHLNRHVIGHKRNSCTICNAQFAKRKALCKHLKIEHSIIESEKLYHCQFCDVQFTKKSFLHEHLKVHADGKLVCLKCGYMSDCKSIYEEHIKEHIRDLKYECQLCEKKFVRRQQLIQHIMGHEKHSCSLCNVTFSTKKLLIKHKRSVHGAHVALIKKNACPVCGRLFAHPKQLQLHERVHTGEKPVKCSHCEKSFCNSRNLSRHMKSVRHLQRVNICEGKVVEIEKPFSCSNCDVRFFRQSSLFRHIEQLHSATKSLKCTHCEYSTKNVTNLKRHQESHTDIKRFVCEMCGLSFRALATLKEHHAFVHSENRSFTCDVCKKSFKNKSTLQRHMKVHSEMRPFKCHCNKDYKRLSHLKRHMASCHHMPFKKNHIPNIYEGVNQDTNSNDDDALLESLDGEKNISSSNRFSTLTTCCNVIVNESSNELLSKLSSPNNQYIDVPLNAMSSLMIKNVHTLSESNPKHTFISSPPTKETSASIANLQADHHPAVSLDETNLNLSPSHFCNFNLSSSPIAMESVASTMQDSITPQDVLSFSSPAESLNRSQTSLQNPNMDAFVTFPLHQSDPTATIPIQSFLMASDITSSQTHLSELNLAQNSASKHLFCDPDDILSLSHYTSNSQISGTPEQLFNPTRDMELWDTADNNSRLKLAGEFIEGACVNNFSTQANSLLPHNLFSNESFQCSLDDNTLNSDFDTLSNLC